MNEIIEEGDEVFWWFVESMCVADCLGAWRWPFVMRHGVGDQLAGLLRSGLAVWMMTALSGCECLSVFFWL